MKPLTAKQQFKSAMHNLRFRLRGVSYDKFKQVTSQSVVAIDGKQFVLSKFLKSGYTDVCSKKIAVYLNRYKGVEICSFCTERKYN